MERHASQIHYEATPEAPPRFRFSQMGPDGTEHQLSDRTVELLAFNMAAGGGSGVETSGVPAGYTYLGQFIAHDLSFDKTVVALGANVAAAALVQGTSPRLDLDSLYGAGPEQSAHLYLDDRLHLKTGKTAPTPDHGELDGFDLPRGPDRTAVIADDRNDDNLAVAQTHLAFIRFHNRVVDLLRPTVAKAKLFDTARELVTKHYQWIIRSDYLPRICSEAVVDDVFANGRKAFETDPEPGAVPTMPIEFSIGTFRLGHSMVRDVYRWNRVHDTVTLVELFAFSAKSGDLGGNDRLPSDMIADFRRLYDFDGAGIGELAARPGELNFAMRIDTRLLGALSSLPLGTFNAEEAPHGRYERNLAFRNLTRARMVGLASGPQMARFLAGKQGIDVVELQPHELLKGKRGAALDGFSADRKRELVERAPLWYYVLREAELNGGKLNGVGARIVAETLHRALEGSDASIVRDRDWRPTLGSDGERFGMVDLLSLAFGRDRSRLAPLG